MGNNKKSNSTIIWDIIAGAIGYRAVFVSYELGLFELLNQQPSTIQDICQHLKIAERPAEALLSACLSLRLVELNDHVFCLSETTGKYLLKESESSFGALFEMITQNPFSTSIDSLKNAVLSNKPQTYGGDDIFQSHQEQVELAKAFTRGMHSISVEPASIWPQCINLSNHHHLLDIGGGSGAHAMGALRIGQIYKPQFLIWNQFVPSLKNTSHTIYWKSVCQVTQEISGHQNFLWPTSTFTHKYSMTGQKTSAFSSLKKALTA